MHFTRASLNVLALVGLSARLGAAQTAAANFTAQRLVNILEAQGGNPNIQSKPNPTDPPNFQYNFNAQFHSSCSLDQREAILFTVKNIAGLADRVQLWETDAFHDCRIVAEPVAHFILLRRRFGKVRYVYQK